MRSMHRLYRLAVALLVLAAGPAVAHAAEGAQPAHPKTEVAVPQPDLGQLETDPSRDILPHDRGLGGEGVTLTRESEVPKLFAARQKLVEVALQQRQVEHQMETVPASQRGGEDVVHDMSIGERREAGFSF